MHSVECTVVMFLQLCGDPLSKVSLFSSCVLIQLCLFIPHANISCPSVFKCVSPSPHTFWHASFVILILMGK